MKILRKAMRNKIIFVCCSSVFLSGCNNLEKGSLSSVVTNKKQSVTIVEDAEENADKVQQKDAPLSQKNAQDTPDIFDEKESTSYLSKDIKHTSEVVSANKKGYWLNFNDVFELALDSSKEYQALNKEVESKILMKEKEEKYFYPNTTLTSETTKYYGSPNPDTNETQDFIVKLDAKLYGSAVHDKIAASQQNLDAGNISLKSQELSVYYTVLKYLTKIELTRQYKKTAEEYRKEIEIYYLKQVNATNEGVSTQTDAMEAKLSVAEFDESVYSVVSNIEQYFKKLSEETGIDLGLDVKNAEDKIGIDYKRLTPLFAKEVSDITAQELLNTNAELRKIQKTLKSSLYSAQATRERFTVDLTAENHLLTHGDTGESKIGDSDESYVQLNLEYDLLNQGAQADQDSAFKMYEAQKLRFDKQYKQYMDQYKTQLTNYNQQLVKRKKTADQIDILAGLIENQKEEIYTDKVTYKDIVESIGKLNKAKQTLLNIDLGLFDTLYELETIKSEKIL